jgi:hypothetical protein
MAEVQLAWSEAEEGRLPPVCLCCAEAAVAYKSGTLTWFPVYIYPLLLGWVFPFLLALLLVQKRVRVLAPFCARHQHYWPRRRALLLGLLLAPFIILGLAFFLNVWERPPEPTRLALFIAVCWFVTLLWVRGKMVHIHAVADLGVTLAGVSEKFVGQIAREREAAARLWLR